MDHDNPSLAEGREIPMDTQSLQQFLEAGPSAPVSSVAPEVPPMPAPQAVPADSKPKEEEGELQPGEGPDEEARKQMALPSDAVANRLKEQYGEIKVVPIPYSRTPDGKVQCYCIRRLTRAQWRAMEDQADNIAKSKPGVSVDDIFAEKIVSLALVWPNLREDLLQSMPAGFVPTLFGVVQQHAMFFNPDAVMAMTFVL